MKNTIKILLSIFLMVPFFTKISCRKKYEDDPWTMRFVNLEKRIEGEWNIQKILIDGVDSTAIIYVDSLQIFSKYIFENYSNSYARGKLKVRSYNDTYRYDYLSFNFIISNDLNNIIFHPSGELWIYLLNNKIILPYGALNNYDGYVEWEIRKLTKKEMFLLTTINLKKYELFFIKMKK